MGECPPRPRNTSRAELGFTPMDRMTPWLSPAHIVSTERRKKMAARFGAYADKREVEAGLAALPPAAYTDEAEIWVDFVADLGDAFGPTYAVASLLARPGLDLRGPGGETHPTARGRVLVMGGDEVYPVASVPAYDDQTLGPYRAALPCVKDDPPHLYAIPGNHDWYDGLTAFLRVFCVPRWIGGWRTHQTRSYFAVQLPHRWWLWGVDTGLDGYLDEPQLRYFDALVGPQMAAGDSVILCTPAPTWVKAHLGRPDSYTALDYLERKLIRPRRAEVRLTLTGDLHHYAHYVRTDGPSPSAPARKLTSGGGGAFLAATHHLPPTLELPHPDSRDPGKSPPTCWELVKAYPSRRESRRLRWRVVALPFHNPGMAVAMGVVHLAFAWMAQAALRSGGDSFSGPIADLSYGGLLRALGRSPLAITAALGLVAGLAGFTKARTAGKKWGLGLAHAVAHLGAVVVVIEVAAAVCSGLGLEGAAFAAVFFVLVGGVGGLVGSFVLAAYLLVADELFGLNDNELFASQRNRDRKSFLRLHLDEDGALTVYPVGVDRTPRRWGLRPDGADDDPWFEPEDGPVAAHLIEEPIRVEPASRPTTAPGPRRPADQGPGGV